MKVVEYNKKYDLGIMKLLIELQEYIITVDKDDLELITDDYREKYFRRILRDVRNNHGALYLAVKGEQVLGLVAGVIIDYDRKDHFNFTCPRKGKIIEVLITNDVSYKNIGKNLILDIEQYFIDEDCEYMDIEVTYNEKMLDFYSKLGFSSRSVNMCRRLD